ncbi:MAG TPA: DUF1622 domain-containing protein [Gemmatimonadaceae bacterium]|jgi:uncharacterized membrane protein|nr:DUF1622 domain-containing protein [Gemmatimonadaceae bacterium]
MSWLAAVTERVIVAIDALALIIVLAGTIEAFVGTMRSFLRPASRETRWRLYATYGRWLVAGLTFQLAADILETTITTTWQAVARLGAVAAIRTFLNYFLERDLRERDIRHSAAGEST